MTLFFKLHKVNDVNLFKFHAGIGTIMFLLNNVLVIFIFKRIQQLLPACFLPAFLSRIAFRTGGKIMFIRPFQKCL